MYICSFNHTDGYIVACIVAEKKKGENLEAGKKESEFYAKFEALAIVS